VFALFLLQTVLSPIKDEYKIRPYNIFHKHYLMMIPFTTGWMGENHFAPVPAAIYGVVLLMAVHSHESVNGRTVRIPHLFKVDDSGDKIIVGDLY
jgi:uncharacterized membrane protein